MILGYTGFVRRETAVIVLFSFLFVLLVFVRSKFWVFVIFAVCVLGEEARKWRRGCGEGIYLFRGYSFLRFEEVVEVGLVGL